MRKIYRIRALNKFQRRAKETSRRDILNRKRGDIEHNLTPQTYITRIRLREYIIANNTCYFQKVNVHVTMSAHDKRDVGIYRETDKRKK